MHLDPEKLLLADVAIFNLPLSSVSSTLRVLSRVGLRFLSLGLDRNLFNCRVALVCAMLG